MVMDRWLSEGVVIFQKSFGQAEIFDAFFITSLIYILDPYFRIYGALIRVEKN
jgi:hypothetical protein